MNIFRESEAARRPAASPISVRRFAVRRWSLYAGEGLLLLLAVVVANVLALHLRPSSVDQLDVGSWGDQHLLSGVFEQETNETGATYRWTTAQAVFRLRDYALIADPVLQLNIGGLPPNAPAPRLVQLQLDTTPLTMPVAATARRYHLVLPGGALADGNVELRLASPTTQVAPDPRDLGVRLDALAVGAIGTRWVLPTWPTMLMQWAIVLVWLGIARRLEQPRWSQIAVAVGVTLLLAVLTGYILLMAASWHARLLLASVLLLGLAWNAPSVLQRYVPALRDQREIRWLLVLTALAIGLRLVAIFYPPWGSHDQYIHRERLYDVQMGSLQLWDRPSEFGGQRTIVQPAFYLLVSPFTLLTVDPGVAIEGVYAFLEGTSALLIAVFVRQIGGSARAAWIAAIALACLPIQLTALWWGFGPQIVGQWLLLLLAVLITLRTLDRRVFWIGIGLVFCLALLMHNGVAALGGVWIAGYTALMWWYARPAGEWKRWAVLIGVTSAVAVALLYADVIALQWSGLVGGATAPQRFENSFRILLIWRGLLSSLRPLDVGLTLASLVALVLGTHRHQRWLIVAWLVSAGLFLSVDVLLGLQVRYAYFAMPLVCAGLGVLLDRFSRAGRWGAAVSWSVMALVVWSGLLLWLPGIFEGIKPTLTALTH